jgi:hypothetical protein
MTPEPPHRSTGNETERHSRERIICDVDLAAWDQAEGMTVDSVLVADLLAASHWQLK